MSYGLKYSADGITWHIAKESAYSNVAEKAGSKRPVIRDRLQDIYREAEFWSKRHRHVKIMFGVKPNLV